MSENTDFNDFPAEARVTAQIEGSTPVAGGNGVAGETNEQAVARLASMKPIEYDRVRQAEADALGVRVATLDGEVEKLRRTLNGSGGEGPGDAVMFPEIEPWPEPVDGGKLLTDLAGTIRRYVIVPWHGARGSALWIVFTHCVGAVSIAPILALTSPERRCGKSTVLALLGRLVLRSLPAANISAAALFRSVEAWAPTLLIDEADTFIQNSDELRGILNSGHTRDSAFVIRTVGDEHEPRRFSTWGAKAIALIGKLPDTLADRSIEIPLKRRLPTEWVEKLRHADPELFTGLARRCARFAADNAEDIRAARPSVPEALHDRAQDNWEPLLAIADLAGGDWPKWAREAALALSGTVDAGDDNIRVQLLSDIRAVFKNRGADCDRLPTVELIADLIALEGRPWGEASRGKPINPHWLAARLRPFGIVRGTKREGDDTFKGYELDQFADAFKRYLPPLPAKDPASDRSHGHNVGGARVSEDFGKVTPRECDRSENAAKASCGAGCDRVTDPEPPPWEDRDTGVIL